MTYDDILCHSTIHASPNWDQPIFHLARRVPSPRFFPSPPRPRPPGEATRKVSNV